MSATLAPGEDGVATLTTVTAAAGEDRMAAAIGAMGATLAPEEEGMATLITVTAAGGGTDNQGGVSPAAPNQVTCAQGYVWREASSTDFVCVTPNARAQAAYDNGQASARSAGGGAYGADTCVQGYVWREAFAGDHVCVTPQTRSQTANDNSLDSSRQVTTILTRPNFPHLHN